MLGQPSELGVRPGADEDLDIVFGESTPALTLQRSRDK